QDPLEITIGQRNQGIENVRHIYYLVAAKNRYQTLKRIADSNTDIYAIIFCRTRLETREVAEKLIGDGYNADALHGELSQGQRDFVMNKFRRRKLQLLVATDVAARGLDVKDLSHVINYNLPDDIASYTHRSGRTGRAGKEGISIAIVHLREKYKIKQIERQLKRKFELGRIPTGQEICRQRMLHYLDILKERKIDATYIESFFPAILENLASLERDELIKRFVLANFSQLLNYYKNAPDLNESEHESKKRYERDRERKSGDGRYGAGAKGKGRDRKDREQKDQGVQFTRFHINVGRKDGVNPSRLIGEINDAAGKGVRIQVGRIEVKGDSCLLEAESRFESNIIRTFSNLQINGRKVVARVSGENEKMTPRSRPKSPHPIRKKAQNKKRKQQS
ncbi:MAG: DbpA RNA binding domain-containing protein, partial [Deltaproteobacteria bacterium]|nr:DbpA RNA binding domain-containing protein [Candidatus Tharpella sp.]